MAQAHYHYMANVFYPEVGGVDGVRMKCHKIMALGDLEAIHLSEFASRFGPGKAAYFQVRKVTRKANVVIHVSSRQPTA